VTSEAYDALAGRLEDVAQRRPFAYKLIVALLAALGYGYIFLLLLLVAGLIVGVIVLGVRSHALVVIWKVEIFLVGLLALLLRSLWVRIPEPAGLLLEREKAAPLFAEIDRLREKVGAPRVHRVLLDDRFNAAVQQVPRLGVFWPKNHLCIGLPLLQALPPEGFRAVLAHELGHLSRAHGRFGAWIYRVRATWERLLTQLEKEGKQGAARLFTWFFEWYAPYFAACSSVLVRRQEYEADRHSAEAAGARNAADALVRLRVAGEHVIKTFWDSVFQLTSAEPAPPEDIFDRLDRAFLAEDWHPGAEERLREALLLSTDAFDTHPCLSDRLAALGEPPHLPEPLGESAARRYLGASLPELATRLSLSWKTAVTASWTKRYRELLDARASLARFEERAAAGERLTVGELWQRAQIQSSVEEEAAIPLYRAVIERDPQHGFAYFQLARLLLERDQEEGVALMERACQERPQLTPDGMALTAVFWRSRGDLDRARGCLRRLA
jgi:Zn-dependent protease with chaperone function